jgi:hypothetical protein
MLLRASRVAERWCHVRGCRRSALELGRQQRLACCCRAKTAELGGYGNSPDSVNVARETFQDTSILRERRASENER